jgi:putative aminopeptidase FrvX
MNKYKCLYSSIHIPFKSSTYIMLKSNKKTPKVRLPKFDAQALTFITQYLNTDAPTGFEQAGQKVWMEYIAPYVDTFYTDVYGSVVGIINPNAKYKIVIEAHADEISRFVKYITDDGFIYVCRNGWSDHMIAPSKKVRIHGDKWVVSGIFGRPAIHTRRSNLKDEPTPKIETIFIDVGCKTKQEVLDLWVRVGSVIVYDEQMHILNDRYVVGKSLDNKIGGIIIAEVARILQQKKIKLPFGLYICNSVQEEVWLYGAKMLAQHIKPDVAIVTDVCHDTSTPMINKIIEWDTRCGDWPILDIAPAIHHGLLKIITDTAEKYKLPFQRLASSFTTSCDADEFAYSGTGVPTVAMLAPTRYIHTTVEMTSIADILHTIDLIVATLQHIPNNHDFRYISLDTIKKLHKKKNKQ